MSSTTTASAQEYYRQFYEPYVQYPAPIMAVPGNHDRASLNPAAEDSLAGFIANFCAPPALTPVPRDTNRAAMTRPSSTGRCGYLEDTQLWAPPRND